MRINRLEINVEYETHSFHVFHTDAEPNTDPPTIICIDGHEYEGHVSFRQCGDSYEIIIRGIS